MRRTTTSVGSATPGSGKRRRSRACARLRTLCKEQRDSDLPGRWRGTFRWDGNSAGFSSERTTEDRGKLGEHGGNVGLSARQHRDNRGCFGVASATRVTEEAPDGMQPVARSLCPEDPTAGEPAGRFPKKEPWRTDEPQIWPDGLCRLRGRPSLGGWWSGHNRNAVKRTG